MISQTNEFKINKPTNVNALLVPQKDFSNARAISVQIYAEGVIAPLTGVVKVLVSNIGGGFGKYAEVASIPIDKAGDNSFIAYLDGGKASVRFLMLNYEATGAGAGNIVTAAICAKQ